MRDGPAAGLALIDAILERGELADYRLAHAARADLLPPPGPSRRRPRSYERALALTRQSRSGDSCSAGWGSSQAAELPGHGTAEFPIVDPRLPRSAIRKERLPAALGPGRPPITSGDPA